MLASIKRDGDTLGCREVSVLRIGAWMVATIVKCSEAIRIRHSPDKVILMMTWS